MRPIYGNFCPDNVLINPELEVLRELAKSEEIVTEFGSPAYFSKISNRSAKFTEIVYDAPNKQQHEMILAGLETLKLRPTVEVYRILGNDPFCTMGCCLLIPEDYSRLAFTWGKLLFENPMFLDRIVTVAIPDWPERKVIVDAKKYVTYIFGTDYVGEIKKSFLRMSMWYAKQELNCLGLHAGSKVLRVENKEGILEDRGAIFFGLSGTGKSTLTCHDHNLQKPEKVTIRQDDVLFMKEDGACFGSENNFYIKTEGLEPKYQRVMYNAFIQPDAVLDNVAVTKDGKVHLEDCSRTTNGRAVICRKNMEDTDESIDLPKVNMVFFITRREDIIPPLVKLNAHQAAAFFMLGESIETSAGDPEKAGQSKREVGTNPFIVGSKGEEGKRFFQMISSMPDVEFFLLNTGRVGGIHGEKITVKMSTDIIKKVAKKQITWKKDNFWGYEIPASIEGLDLTPYDVDQYYTKEEILEKNNTLYQERIKWLHQFPEISEEIVQSLLNS